MRLIASLLTIALVTLQNDGVRAFEIEDLYTHDELFERENMIGSDMTTVS